MSPRNAFAYVQSHAAHGLPASLYELIRSDLGPVPFCVDVDAGATPAAAPTTAPSHMTMFTGLQPSAHGIKGGGELHPLSPGVATPAQHLRAPQARTGAVRSRTPSAYRPQSRNQRRQSRSALMTPTAIPQHTAKAGVSRKHTAKPAHRPAAIIHMRFPVRSRAEKASRASALNTR